ncbi:hypothetical protein MNBD_GAMMA18-1517 [hydrothermal vent metagenome]|uniref:Glycosyl transferase family 1 domain-containing protein n=1 Tax=hydrothermal vent metagenome TaxID=652676 RepID=A0A3B0Z4P3_9ZZZZ
MVTRVALYGNTCNNLYQLAKLLRNELQVDAHLFLPNNADIQNRPESDDPELTDNYPDWIHVGRYRSPIAQYLPMFSPLINDVKNFDYIIFSQKGPSLAPYLKPKTFFLVTGGDLTRAPFYGRTYRWYKSFPAKILGVVRAYWQRTGLRQVDETWVQPFKPLKTALADLGIKTYNREKYFPVILDAPGKVSGTELDDTLSNLRNNWDFLIFNPARMMLDETPDMVATGAWKNNLALLYGFAEFLKTTGATRAAFVFVDKGDGHREKHGRERFLQEADRLGIKDKVISLKPPASQDVYTRAQLFRLYELSDVVGNDYGVGWFGSIVLEGLSMAKPVISYVEESVMHELYGDHPLISVREPDEIADALTRLYKDPDYRFKVGQKGRAWYKKHHSPQGAKRRYIENLEFLKSGDVKPSNGTENSN